MSPAHIVNNNNPPIVSTIRNKSNTSLLGKQLCTYCKKGFIYTVHTNDCIGCYTIQHRKKMCQMCCIKSTCGRCGIDIPMTNLLTIHTCQKCEEFNVKLLLNPHFREEQMKKETNQ